jgi:hypothetical protein
MGDSGSASATGKQGCSVSLGIQSQGKGAKGSWITLAEWEKDADSQWQRIDVQTVRVDGEKIKPDTWYQLVAGEFKEVT